MEKQTLIRGAAIVIAGIAASTYAAQNLLSKSPSAPVVSDAKVPAQPSQVLGAGLVSSGGQLSIEPRKTGAEQPTGPTKLANGLSTEEPAQETTVLASLSDVASQPSTLAGNDLAMQLARAEPDATDQSASCTPRLDVAASVDALIEVQLIAPCHPNERVVISHGDLAFSGFTSLEGRFNSYLPALASDAKIDVFLSDDQFLQAAVSVESVDQHLRVVLQWSGGAGFGLHAFHNGAQFGSDGHLHASRPFDPDHDAAFLISLGAAHGPEPMRADVYSIPAEQASIARMEVEMRYSSDQCGQDISAYLLQTGPGADSAVREIVFSVPDCPTSDGLLVMTIPLDAARHSGNLRGEHLLATQN